MELYSFRTLLCDTWAHVVPEVKKSALHV